MENSPLHSRKINRLKGYDYSQNGVYFITACIQNRECLLGEIKNDVMKLNDAGRMVSKWWEKIAEKFPCVVLDEFVVMPNHIHGIILIENEDAGRDKPVCLSNRNIGFPSGTTRGSSPTIPPNGMPHGASPTTSQTNPTISDMMQWFKTMTTNEYIRNVKSSGWKPFHKKLWQRSFYDHIIRNEKGFENIREYIRNNPLKWALDKENPENF